MKRKMTCYLLVCVLWIMALPVVAYGQDEPSPWAKEDVQKAIDSGIVPSSLQNNYTTAITRGDFCTLIVETLETYYNQDIERIAASWGVSLDDNPFNDTKERSVVAANKLGIVNGVSKGKFQPDGVITREQAAVMLSNTAQTTGIDIRFRQASFVDCTAISDWALTGVAYACDEGIMGGVGKNYFDPKGTYTREQAYITAYRLLILLDPYYDIEDNMGVTGPVIDGEEEVPETGLPGESIEPEGSQGKYDIPKYTSQQEAEQDMVGVTVPVWELSSDGNKYPRMMELTIHRYLANDVQGIFNEIFSGSEQFPIHTIGGYSWRGSSKSEHSRGSAIDLNPNENYFVSPSGNILAGNFWAPWDNPYSILPSGDVVRAFEAKGWQWGVGRWSNGNDYMHFSYYGT